MGVVYLARDTRLDREVAIKALPGHLATDPARHERFEREAKTLAGLSHPNVAGIYGVEEQNGARYLVLEYVDGETLADRLDRGPLPLDEAVEYAAQIAAGVEAAHEAGVIHRDLKPANIKLTPDGVAKVLDFGLARVEEAGSSTGGLDSPTMTTPQPQHSPTIEGAILGTAAYMSPEQARGRRVDKRTDIWSFGVVLYEMLVGASPFYGETATDSIGAVLHKNIDLARLPAGAPRDLRRLITRCLQRDKSMRLQSIGDARVELQHTLERLESSESDSIDAETTVASSKVWPIATACFAIAALTGFGLWITSPAATNSQESNPVRPATSAPTVVSVEQITDFSLGVWGVSLSSDGSTVAYGAWETGQDPDLYSLRVGGANPINLTRSPATSSVFPAFSPDGESIAYLSRPDNTGQGGLFVMGATGESPRRIAEYPSWSPAWSPDGQSLAFTTSWLNGIYDRLADSELWVVDVATREKRLIDTNRALPGGDTDPWFSDAVSPSWSPDGSRLAFWGNTRGTRDIFTVSADGGDVIQITDDVPTDWNPLWSPDGKAIWYLSDRGGNAGLWSVPLDDAGGPADEPHPIMLGPGKITAASRSADGRSVVVLARTTRQYVERIKFDPETERFSGLPETMLENTAGMQFPVISQDGQWIAYFSAPPEEDITIMRLDGTDRRRLTQSVAKDRFPSWTPDNKTLYYQSNQSGSYQLWTVNRESAETKMIPFDSESGLMSPFVSPDGTKIVFMRSNDRLQFASLADDGSIGDSQPAPAGFAIADSGDWSPDSRRFVGVQQNPGGTPTGVVLDTQADAMFPIRKPDGNTVPYSTFMKWLDSTRLLAQDGDAESAFVFDIETNESRWVPDTPTGLGRYISYRPDGWLYFLRSEETSNLWLITLDLGNSD